LCLANTRNTAADQRKKHLIAPHAKMSLMFPPRGFCCKIKTHLGRAAPAIPNPESIGDAGHRS
jgi:hypothetical protein